MTESIEQVAVVTGANRGLGYEVCRQLRDAGLTVVLTARSGPDAARAASELGVRHHQLDVTSEQSAAELAAWLGGVSARVSVLVNNAGAHYDAGRFAEADAGLLLQTLSINTVGPVRVVQALEPLMVDGARIVNVSSGAGSFAETGSSARVPTYSVSKAALNMVTVKLAAQLRPRGILVNAVCPGWVATDMGGPGGRPVAEGAVGIVWAATLPADGPTGSFFRDGRPIGW